jgi:phosphatidylserine/phosphatidylglycerophosphate/cardiolipin synthase-like enzyme
VNARTAPRLAAFVTALLLTLAPTSAPAESSRTFAAQGTVEVAFAPWDDLEAVVVRAIEGARKQILVQAFSFTSRRIAAALVAARARGIDVQVTADREQTYSGERSRIPDLAAGGIPVWLEVRYQAAHNKVMVIDAGTSTPVLITGSANWTSAAARKNAENVLVLRNSHALTRAYADNWRRHRADALPYGGRP